MSKFLDKLKDALQGCDCTGVTAKYACKLLDNLKGV